MARKHYHVLQGLRGCYMPNDNEVHTSRRSAEASARWHASTAREDDFSVQGSAREGFYSLNDGTCIEITSCDVADCLEGLED